jgi:hypothetical protein
MPPTIAATFVLGHFAHEMCYATVLSALPDSIKMHTEIELKTGFPEDCNQDGTCDFVLERVSDEANDWISEDAPKYIMGDFKTQTGFSFRAHKKADFKEQGTDPWGYVAQLTTYAHSPTLQEKFPDIEKNGALLVGVNKESPQMGICPRLVPAKTLEHAKNRLDLVLKTTEWPGPWLMDTFGAKETAFFCGASGRAGYCGFTRVCQEKRKERTYDV